MIPLMRHSFYILCLAAATSCWAEDYAIQNSSGNSAENSPVFIYISSQNSEVSRAINLGLLECLLQQPERARNYFQKAEQGDSECLFAHLGILLCTQSHTPLYREHLGKLNQLLDTVVLTPVEEWYISTFLQYLNGDLKGAADAFRKRASVYRKDNMAAAWDIKLNHLAGEEAQSLSKRAQEYLNRQPESTIAHYCRAILEEYAAQPSDAALQSASFAADKDTEQPAYALLAGHLNARAGKSSDALRYMQRISSHPVAQLYIPALLLSQGDTKSRQKAFLSARKAAENACKLQPETDEQKILYWEGHTLLLRMLVLQQNTPSRAAIQTALNISKAPENSLLSIAQNCLVAAIQTRSLADMGRTSTAHTTLSKAEKLLNRLQHEGTQLSNLTGVDSLCYQRALKACQGAVIRARLALYTDSKDIWQPHLNQILEAAYPHCLPPILPR